jgi:phage terminase small subunit
MKEKPKQKKMTLKQRKFTKEYLKSGNGTQAAIKAGYSKKSAHDIASENLRKPEIKAAVASAAEKLGINPEYVLAGIKKIKEFNEVPEEFTVGQGENVRLKTAMRDANAALKANELLAKHLNLFTEKAEIDLKIEDVSESKSKLELAKQIALALKFPDEI